MSEQELKQAEMLAGLRNAFQQAIENIDAYLNWLGQRQGFKDAESKPQQASIGENIFTFSKLFWETREGNKGPYQQTSKNANSNSDLWQQLQQKLKDHKGFWRQGCMRYWFHQNDQDIVDRRDGGSNDKKQGTE